MFLILLKHIFMDISRVAWAANMFWTLFGGGIEAPKVHEVENYSNPPYLVHNGDRVEFIGFF